MYPDLLTKLIFNNNVVIEVSSDYESHVMFNVYNTDDEHESAHRGFLVEPDEIDLLISTLNLYKHRILNGRKDVYE
ncbi:hypothetical protein ACQKMN_16985 [Ureibacillus composti]